MALNHGSLDKCHNFIDDLKIEVDDRDGMYALAGDTHANDNNLTRHKYL